MPAQRKTSEDFDPLAHAEAMRRAVDAVLMAALASCVVGNIEEIVRKWLAHARIGATDSSALELAAEASILANEIAVYTPSMSGTRPIDRLARSIAI